LNFADAIMTMAALTTSLTVTVTRLRETGMCWPSSLKMCRIREINGRERRVPESSLN
jgi:hypothetical protein